ncbi:MAG: hypothetical protein JWN12_468 [Candidatus Saccharibacteria bacterium]|nr:hypothetical protein [Candidatus Saccharibacteria bacterium]
MNNFLLKLAVTLVGDNKTTVNIPNLTGEQVLHNGLNIAYFLAGTIAVIVIIIGGIMYVTAAGNSGNITKAKNMLLYAVVGLVIVIAAYAITNYVIVGFN